MCKVFSCVFVLFLVMDFIKIIQEILIRIRDLIDFKGFSCFFVYGF